VIHQLIFAGPKPGMTAEAFQDYWVNVHAAKYASKIKQIKRYLIDTRVPFAGDLGTPSLPHQGVAEIWLQNEEEQLASLQSPEFLEGARLDEPNWAAVWLTFVLDTTAHVILDQLPPTRTPTGVKALLLLKRKPGIPLQTFRQYGLRVHAPIVRELPGLRRYLQCHTRDGFYVFGEAGFDAVEQLWFDDLQALEAAWHSRLFTTDVQCGLENFVDEKHLFSIVAREHWIIGPDMR
jgi:uncharacterized protein (TIGR02118 family)